MLITVNGHGFAKRRGLARKEEETILGYPEA
jgi:hypothetical protein